MPSRCLIISLFCVLGIPSCVLGQIRGPMLGWVWDSRLESIRPILGIAGSSVLGKSVPLGFAVKQANINGSQEHAIAITGDARAATIVDLRPLEPTFRGVDGIPDGAARLAVSTRGTSAVFVYEDPKTLRVAGGLPGEPALLREIDLTNEGLPSALAVSDDGAIVLASYPDQRMVLMIDQDGNRLKLAQEMAATSMYFRENSRDVFFAADDGAYLVTDVSGNAETRKIWEVATSAATVRQGPVVLLVEKPNQQVVELNLENGESRTTQCPCAPTGLVRMTGSSIFRLNEVSADPLWLLEIQDSGLRTVFVPPDVSETEI